MALPIGASVSCHMQGLFDATNKSLAKKKTNISHQNITLIFMVGFVAYHVAAKIGFNSVDMSYVRCPELLATIIKGPLV